MVDEKRTVDRYYKKCCEAASPEIKEKCFEYHSIISVESNVTDIVCYTSKALNLFIYGQNNGEIIKM